MTRTAARTLLLTLALALLATVPGARSQRLRGGESADAQPEKTVFLGGQMSDEERIVFTSAIAAARHPGVVLFDTPKARPHLARFLEQFGAEAVQPVGRFEDGDRLGEWLKTTPQPTIGFEGGYPEELWARLFRKAANVVVCPPAPRSLLLKSAAMAAAIGAPLVVLHEKDIHAGLIRWANHWQPDNIFAIGPGRIDIPRFGGDSGSGIDAPATDFKVTYLADEAAVEKIHMAKLDDGHAIRNLVVTNPDHAKWASLAPWLAVQKHAALLLTDKTGRDVNELVYSAVKRPELRSADHVILLGDRNAIPTSSRPNPIAGKDADIEMEPLTPEGNAPFSFAVGRLFGADPGIVALQLARQRLMNSDGPRKAVVISNPGGGLPLLETVSRHTTQELRYCGFETQAIFGKDVAGPDVRRAMPGADLFLWEGHHATLVKEYGFTEWDEPLKPSLVILQSCLALMEEKSLPLFERGAVGVVGSATRTYSASGGAFSLAYVDALIYDRQSFGGALRQAKNFLVTYQMLKEKRLKQTKLSGANQRSSWAFTLWGDPTLHLSLPARPAENAAAVHHRVAPGPAIIVDIPATNFEPVSSGKFQAHMQPNTRLAGFLRPGEGSAANESRLVPFVFAEVELPSVPAGKTPRFKTKLPNDSWAFCWDARRSVGYLLVLPRAKDQGGIRFAVESDPDS